MRQEDQPGLLVVAAHPGDFVWRAAGAIALHCAAGWRVTVVCASFGVKGEAGVLWQKEGATVENVTAARKDEAEAAVSVLGANLVCLNLQDYPLVPTTADTLTVAKLMREFRPQVVLTHPPKDPSNIDHVSISSLTMQARSCALAPGYGKDVIDPPAVHFFEPHQPEQSDFKADLFLNITQFWSVKRRAFEAIGSQRGVWDYYERVALQRGAQASRRSRDTVKYAEAYQRAFPAVLNQFD